MDPETRKTHRCGDVGASDTLDGCIQVVEGFALNNLCTDLTANTERRESSFNNNQSVIEGMSK